MYQNVVKYFAYKLLQIQLGKEFDAFIKNLSQDKTATAKVVMALLQANACLFFMLSTFIFIVYIINVPYIICIILFCILGTCAQRARNKWGRLLVDE